MVRSCVRRKAFGHIHNDSLRRIHPRHTEVPIFICISILGRGPSPRPTILPYHHGSGLVPGPTLGGLSEEEEPLLEGEGPSDGSWTPPTCYTCPRGHTYPGIDRGASRGPRGPPRPGSPKRIIYGSLGEHLRHMATLLFRSALKKNITMAYFRFRMHGG